MYLGLKYFLQTLENHFKMKIQKLDFLKFGTL